MNNVSGRQCPLCGADNGCAVSAGKDPASCWCFAADVVIPASARTAVAADRQPGQEDASCICQHCARRYKLRDAEHSEQHSDLEPEQEPEQHPEQKG
ncbi:MULTISPECIES: cysteine-rich CWC family protein [unclassified Thalassolituus]|uniref:cysteine-rich CWC family protein n=1 Tax=unclassified Thalassolituus TaxID=2624967 RepID=UPI0025D87904|nr:MULTISPECIES: cysteine-rich CWC family protein [unclassified Thalassolituus]